MTFDINDNDPTPNNDKMIATITKNKKKTEAAELIKILQKTNMVTDNMN